MKPIEQAYGHYLVLKTDSSAQFNIDEYVKEIVPARKFGSSNFTMNRGYGTPKSESSTQYSSDTLYSAAVSSSFCYQGKSDIQKLVSRYCLSQEMKPGKPQWDIAIVHLPPVLINKGKTLVVLRFHPLLLEQQTVHSLLNDVFRIPVQKFPLFYLNRHNHEISIPYPQTVIQTFEQKLSALNKVNVSGYKQVS